MFPGSVVLAIAGDRVALLPGAAQEYRDHFVMLFTPHGRNRKGRRQCPRHAARLTVPSCSSVVGVMMPDRESAHSMESVNLFGSGFAGSGDHCAAYCR